MPQIIQQVFHVTVAAGGFEIRSLPPAVSVFNVTVSDGAYTVIYADHVDQFQVTVEEPTYAVQMTDAVLFEVTMPNPLGRGLPGGGTHYQVLRKASNASYDAEWGQVVLSMLESGGATIGQTLVWNGSTWVPGTVSGGGGGGAVDSVNGQTGVVVLDYADVGAAPLVHVHVAADITDFDAAVSSSPDVALNTVARHEHLNKIELDLITDGDHDVRTDNPHGVTPSQIGATEEAPSDSTLYGRFNGAWQSVQSWLAGNTAELVEEIQFDTTFVPSTHAEGLLHWNDDAGTLEVGMPGGNVVLQIGQEMLVRVWNGSGATISNGSVVWQVGSFSNRPSIDLADATGGPTLGASVAMATEDIANNSFGYCTFIGLVRDLNTSAWSEGDQLYLSTTPGQLTTTPPSAPNYRIWMAVVVRSHSTEGSVFFRPGVGHVMSDLADVNGTPPTAILKHLVWNDAAGYWDAAVVDHGDLDGLADDDHPQYLNEARGDARYALLGHTHPVSDLEQSGATTNQALLWNGASWAPASLTTDVVAEGSNLYYTEARVSANVDVAANTAARHTHANKAELDLITDGDHDVRTDNPHAVTAVQVGAAPTSHSHVAADITDFDTEVSANTDVAANTDFREEVYPFFWGSSVESTSVAVTSNGTTITLTLDNAENPGTDVTYEFASDILVTMPATVSLTPGTDTVPVLNYIWLTDAGVLTASTAGWPSGPYAPVATVMCQSATGVQSYGALKVHNWNNHIYEATANGHLMHLNFWIRQQHSTWLSGAQGSISINSVPNPDEIFFSMTSGTALQLHINAFSSMDTETGDVVFVVNHNTTPYLPVSDLWDLDTDANGDTLNSRYFSLVFLAVVNSDGTAQVLCNLPIGSYSNASDAISDVESYANFNLPVEFRGTGILVARAVLHRSPSGVATLEQLDDLRGNLIGTVGGGGAGGATGSEFSDALFTLHNTTDPTKRAMFSLGSLTTATTRTYALPDVDGELLIDAPSDGTIYGRQNAAWAAVAAASHTHSAADISSGTFPDVGTAAYKFGTAALQITGSGILLLGDNNTAHTIYFYDGGLYNRYLRYDNDIFTFSHQVSCPTLVATTVQATNWTGLDPSDLGQQAATTGDVLYWSGSQWEPLTPTWADASHTHVVADITDWATADLSVNSLAATVRVTAPEVRVSGADMFLGYGGPDQDQSIYFHEGGSNTGRRFRWDNTENRFDFNDTVYVQGSLNLTNRVFLNIDGPDGNSYIHFYDGGSITGQTLSWNDASARFELTATLRLLSGDVRANNLVADGALYMNYGGPDGDAFLYFYDGSNPQGAYIKWDDPSNRFETSDDVYVGGRLLANNGSNDFPLYLQSTDTACGLQMNDSGGTGDLYYAGAAGANGRWYFRDNADTQLLYMDDAELVIADGMHIPYVTTMLNTRGSDNLVSNALGDLGNNYNFSTWTWDPEVVYDETGYAAFVLTSGSVTRFNDEILPVDPSQVYELSVWLMADAGGSSHYIGVACYDTDGLLIDTRHFMHFTNTQTTLAADLEPGDTVVQLTDASNWQGASGGTGVAAYNRAFVTYGYENGSGHVYADYTYSRDHSGDAAWDDTGTEFSGNTLTLSTTAFPTGWDGPTIPAGTAIANASAGSSYKYIAASNESSPTTWTNYSGFIGGVDSPGQNSARSFPAGTAGVKLLFLINRTTPNTTRIFAPYFGPPVLDWQAGVAAPSLTLPGDLDLNGNDLTANGITAGAVSMSGVLTIDRGSTANATWINLVNDNQDAKLRMGDDSGDYGFYFLYKGTGSGVNNSLEFYAENQTGTHVLVYTVNQDGDFSFNGNLDVSGEITDGLTAYQSSDLSKTSDVTPSNTDMAVTVEAGGKYIVDMMILAEGGGALTGDGSITLSMPSGASMRLSADMTSGASSTTKVMIDLDGTTTVMYRVSGILLVGGTAGTVTVGWAQWSSYGTASILKTGSMLALRRIA